MERNYKRLNVLYDNQIFEIQKYGGISRYFYETAKRMDKVDIKIALIFSNNHYISEKDVTKYISSIPEPVYKFMRGVVKKVNNMNSIIKLAKDFDLLHPTYYNPYFLPYLKEKKYVLTVHDMIHEIFPEYFSPKDKTAQNKALLVEKASRIIAISENTKRDLINILNVDSDKIDVIYHGITVQEPAECNIQLPEQYILYVGERNGYKNFSRLLEAFQEIAKRHPGMKLICTGKKFKSVELCKFKELGLENEIIHFSANDVVLGHLYRNAALMVYPSLYEGFGIPILESFSFNCPIALSNTSCFPEIAGDSGVYFDPYSVKDIIDALERIITDTKRRNILIERGRERVKRYTWNETARQTQETYFKTLGISSY